MQRQTDADGRFRIVAPPGRGTLELRAIPYLMCEAMIAEAVLPIAATGSFGRISGFPFLQMIERKVKWVMENLEELASVLER